jgi:hypothetical protein
MNVFNELIMVLHPVEGSTKDKVEIQKMWRLPMKSGYPFFGYYFGEANLCNVFGRNLLL